MKANHHMDWQSYLDNLIITESSFEWKPFPNKFLSIHTDKLIETRQISTKMPTVHVIAKITEDFEVDTNQVEISMPTQVFCWNDVSTLSSKVAFKTISNSLENQYRKLVNNITFDIKSFSSTSKPNFPDERPDYLIYHIINPSLSMQTFSTKSKKYKYSFSNNHLSNQMIKKSSPFNPIGIPETIDHLSLQKLGESLIEPSVFIFDCPNSSQLLNTIISANGFIMNQQSKTQPIFAFGASTGILPCSPDLPYDLFTSCLLTPAKVALLMQTRVYGDINSGVLSPIQIQDLIHILDNSPISEKILDSLEKALEQFADRIAYETLEKNNIPLFELVFRLDPFIANLFYHYLFACRIMKLVSNNTFCYPSLPDMTNHPLWDTFDLEVDRCLYSLKKNIEVFSIDVLLGEQIQLLEEWMAYPAENREMPDELSYLPLLLDSPKYFERAIRFTSEFLSISSQTTEKFLNTRAFPVLIHKIPTIKTFISTLITEHKNTDNKQVIPKEKEGIFADFSFSIASSILISPKLISLFSNNISLWVDLLQVAVSERLIISCLACLIQFEVDGAVSIVDHIKSFCRHSSSSVRTLSHLLLKKMKVPLELPIPKVSDEEDPLCRVALVSRIGESINETNLDDLAYDMILSLNDPFSFVREEALTSLALTITLAFSNNTINTTSHNSSNTINQNNSQENTTSSLNNSNEDQNISQENQTNFNSNVQNVDGSCNFLEAFSSYLMNYQEDEIHNPIAIILTRALTFLMYDPSIRVRQKFSDFLQYLDSLISAKTHQKDESNEINPTFALRSSITACCLTSIVHYTSETLNENLNISHAPLNGSLVGSLAVSPSGFIASADSSGGILCQSPNNGTSYFDFFNQPINLPQRFKGLATPTKTNSRYQQQKSLQRRICSPIYLNYIDDEKLLSVSDSSQVIIIDMQDYYSTSSSSNELYMNSFDYFDFVKNDPACSFWMEHPDTCYGLKVDYNHDSYHLIEHQMNPESSKLSIFDLSSQRKTLDLIINRPYQHNENNDNINNPSVFNDVSCMGWVHSFSSLFYVCQKNFTVYDERIGGPVQSFDLNLTGDDVAICCNASLSIPLNFIIAKKYGTLSMLDFRTMNIVEEKQCFGPGNRQIMMFDVHRQIPFGFGISNDYVPFTAMYESGLLSVNLKESSGVIHGFSLHPNEAACVARSGTCAKYLEIRLD